MPCLTQNNSEQFFSSNINACIKNNAAFNIKRCNGFLLFFASAAAMAHVGIINLPETYRTPLSDMMYDDLKEWRPNAEEENPWREDEEDLIITPRIKVELFPAYSPDSSGNPVSGSLFQNENEVEKPVSNILEYSF